MAQTRRKKVLTASGTLLLGLALAILIVVLCQDLLIFPGVASTLAGNTPDRSRIPSDSEITRIKSYDGTSLEVWHQPLKDGRAPGMTVLFFHGNASFVDMTPFVQEFVDALDMDVYSLEFRGFGRSEGWPSEESFKRDAIHFYEYVTKEKGVDPQSILIMGESVGTGPAAYLASERDVPILVLLAAYSSIPDVVNERAVLRWLIPLVWYHFPVSDYLESLKDTCTILVHGELDPVISFDHLARNQKMFDSKESLHVLTYPQAGHFLWHVAREDVQSKIRSCMEPA